MSCGVISRLGVLYAAAAVPGALEEVRSATRSGTDAGRRARTRSGDRRARGSCSSYFDGSIERDAGVMPLEHEVTRRHRSGELVQRRIATIR